MRFPKKDGSRPQSPAALAGRLVVDPQLAKVGTITDVLVDQERQRWAVVRTSPLRRKHLMPLDETYLDTNGRIVTAIDKMTISHAPGVQRDHTLTAEGRRRLYEYFGAPIRQPQSPHGS